MRKLLLILLALLMLPGWTVAAHKHGQKLNDLMHKKRVKKAKKEAMPKKSILKHHKQ